MMPVMRSNSWIPSVFNDLFDTDFMPKANCTAPAINVKESDKAYTVELAAPGMKKEDFNVPWNSAYLSRSPRGERPLVELYLEPGGFSGRCTG